MPVRVKQFSGEMPQDTMVADDDCVSVRFTKEGVPNEALLPTKNFKQYLHELRRREGYIIFDVCPSADIKKVASEYVRYYMSKGIKVQ